MRHSNEVEWKPACSQDDESCLHSCPTSLALGSQALPAGSLRCALVWCRILQCGISGGLSLLPMLVGSLHFCIIGWRLWGEVGDWRHSLRELSWEGYNVCYQCHLCLRGYRFQWMVVTRIHFISSKSLNHSLCSQRTDEKLDAMPLMKAACMEHLHTQSPKKFSTDHLSCTTIHLP